METYAKNVFFILTCNNINKVIPPLQNRCKPIEFSRPNKDEVKLYLEGICKNENLEYTDDGLKTLIDMKYPSIRNCVMILQDLYTQGLPVAKENIQVNNSDFDKMWKLLKEKKWFDVKKYIMGTTVSPQEFNSYLWEKGINMENPNIKFIQITCRNEKDIAWGADAKIIVTTSLIEICKVLE
jgi:DNA polymerase III delta prime subunit